MLKLIHRRIHNFLAFDIQAGITTQEGNLSNLESANHLELSPACFIKSRESGLNRTQCSGPGSGGLET